MQHRRRCELLSLALWATLCLPAAAEDLLLKDLIAAALRANPDIRAAELRAEAATRRISQESSWEDPMLAVAYQNEGSKRYNYGDSADAQWITSLSQTLPFPGKLSFQRGSASFEAQAQKAAAETLRRELISRITQAYYDLILTAKELDLIQARKPLAARLEEVALARYGAGLGSQQDVLIAQSSKYLLAESAAMARNRQEATKALLNRATGGTLANNLDHAADFIATPFDYPLDDLVRKALTGAPELDEKKSMASAAENRLRRAKREAWPDLTLMAQYAQRGSDFSNMLMVQASVPLPIFYKQKQGAAVAESSLKLTAAQRDTEAAELQVASEIRENLAMLQAADKLIELYQKGLIPKARQNLDAALARFAAGKTSAAEALAALQAPFDYELVLWQQRVQREKAIARITALTGDMEERQ